MSEQPNKEQERRHIARQRRKFEGWMRRYWGGINLSVRHVLRHEFEYAETAAQTAWEVWQKFNRVNS